MVIAQATRIRMIMRKKSLKVYSNLKSWQMPPGKRPPVIDFQNEIVEMYVRHEGVEEGVENGRGRRFIRWAFDKRLGAKLRQNINSSFYIRYYYAYVLVNNETGFRMVFYKKRKGSPWINNFAEAERWMITSISQTRNGLL